MKEKLRQWGADPKAQHRIVQRLVEERFIDETRYAHAFAFDKMRYAQWGRIKIDYALRMMGISSADRQTALNELPEDEYRDLLHHLAQSKLKTIRAKSDYERKAKLMRFLTGKGFELSLVQELADSLD